MQRTQTQTGVKSDCNTVAN